VLLVSHLQLIKMLFRFPTEVRCTVWQALLTNVNTEVLDPFTLNKPYPHLSSQVLRLCEMFHEEGRCILYGSNHFYLKTSRLRGFLTTIGPKNAELIRHLSLQLHLLPSFQESDLWVSLRDVWSNLKTIYIKVGHADSEKTALTRTAEYAKNLLLVTNTWKAGDVKCFLEISVRRNTGLHILFDFEEDVYIYSLVQKTMVHHGQVSRKPRLQMILQTDSERAEHEERVRQVEKICPGSKEGVVHAGGAGRWCRQVGKFET
jgi:hypothetical protein